jgi:hypothetical protein
MLCHGALYAHNIEFDIVSHWERMGFCRFDRCIVRDIRQGMLVSDALLAVTQNPQARFWSS